ncbi:hypothetical protein HYH96_08455 [Clostridium botulinum]|uniref:hypothetical protein n=1 Tax=Clostridium botulinum TaxID=1491 RepID=UPI00174A9FF2|nr:hypothetical protein [Clostridium botulinum]MBD5643928.1 hypothetical protein [Clostridium botulinum]
MGLFGNKEEKEKKKLEELNAKMEGLGLEGLSVEEKKQARMILYNLWGTTLISLGSKAEDNAKIDLAKAQIEQNWLILRKLDSIEKELKKLNSK